MYIRILMDNTVNSFICCLLRFFLQFFKFCFFFFGFSKIMLTIMTNKQTTDSFVRLQELLHTNTCRHSHACVCLYIHIHEQFPFFSIFNIILHKWQRLHKCLLCCCHCYFQLSYSYLLLMLSCMLQNKKKQKK